MTSQHSMQNDSGEQLTLFAVDSPANHSALAESETVRTINENSVAKCYESFVNHYQCGASLKTCVAYFLRGGGWHSRISALNWKVSVTKFNRLLFHLTASDLTTREKGFGYSQEDLMQQLVIPTPREGSWEKYSTRAKRKGHLVAVSYLETFLDFLGFKQYPEFTENLMGFPEKWTDLETES